MSQKVSQWIKNVEWYACFTTTKALCAWSTPCTKSAFCTKSTFCAGSARCKTISHGGSAPPLPLLSGKNCKTNKLILRLFTGCIADNDDFDLSWPILTYIDKSSPILTYIELSWPILTYLDLSWPSGKLCSLCMVMLVRAKNDYTPNCTFSVECNYSAKCSFIAKCKVHF